MAKHVAGVVVMFVFSTPARATPCGGSSDDGGGDSTSMFDDDDDDDVTSSAPSEPWSAKPPITIDVGFATRLFASPLGTETGSVTHDGESFSYRATNRQPRELDTALVGQLRIGKPLGYNFYVAGELELGALTGATVDAEMTSSGTLGSPSITPSSVLLVGGAGVVGLGGRVTSFADLGVELVGGVRALAYQFDSTYLACETTSTVTTAHAVFEARMRASLWLTPHVSLSALAGKSALDDGGVVGGLSIGFTNHAFAGR